MAVYHAGLSLAAIMFVVRGVIQVLGMPLFSAVDAFISGISHIMLEINLMFFCCRPEKTLQLIADYILYKIHYQTIIERNKNAGDKFFFYKSDTIVRNNKKYNILKIYYLDIMLCQIN